MGFGEAPVLVSADSRSGFVVYVTRMQRPFERPLAAESTSSSELCARVSPGTSTPLSAAVRHPAGRVRGS